MNNTTQQLTKKLDNFYSKIKKIKVIKYINDLDELKEEIKLLYNELEQIDTDKEHRDKWDRSGILDYDLSMIRNTYGVCHLILGHIEEKIKDIEEGRPLINNILNKYKKEKFNFEYKSYSEQEEFILNKYKDINNQDILDIIDKTYIDKLNCISDHNNKHNKIFINSFKELKINYNIGLNKIINYYNDKHSVLYNH